MHELDVAHIDEPVGQRVQVHAPDLDVVDAPLREREQVVQATGLEADGIVELARRREKTVLDIPGDALRIRLYAGEVEDRHKPVPVAFLRAAHARILPCGTGGGERDDRPAPFHALRRNVEVELVAIHPCGGHEPLAEGEIDVDAAVRHQPLAVLPGQVGAIGAFARKWTGEAGGDDFVFVGDGRRIGVRPQVLAVPCDVPDEHLVDGRQFRNGRYGRQMHARVDFRLVLAEIAHDARMVGRERVRRLRHAPVRGHAQRLALEAEFPLEGEGSNRRFPDIKHGEPPPVTTSRSRLQSLQWLRRVPADPAVQGLGW